MGRRNVKVVTRMGMLKAVTKVSSMKLPSSMLTLDVPQVFPFVSKPRETKQVYPICESSS